MRHCPKCGSHKSLDMFVKNRSKADGLSEWCKSCHAESTHRWRQANPEKAKASLAVVRARQRESGRAAEARREWYHANRESVLAKAKEYFAANPEKAKARREASSERGRKNRAMVTAQQKRSRAKSPDKYRAIRQAVKGRRRQREECAAGGGVTASQWGSVVYEFAGACAYCLRSDVALAMEHVEPLFYGGMHDVSNIVPSCRECNSKKGTLSVLEFLTGFRLNGRAQRKAG